MIFNKATVYGGGLIGCGWAVCFLTHGVEVTVYDLDAGKLQDAKNRIGNILGFLAEPGIQVLSQKQKEEYLAGIRYTDDAKSAVEDAQFIQENGPEKLAVKQSIIDTIEKFNSTAIISSSTSALLASDIAAKARYPQRIIAGHPFHPVHLVPLVELAKGENTAEETAAKTCAFYRDIGKEPVVLMKECKGFIANSMQNALYNAAFDLVSQGICSVEDADRAVTFGPGLRWGLMGPYMVLELAGGSGGIRSRMTKYGDNPAIDVEQVCKGVEAEFAKRNPAKGNDHASLEHFRDEGLIGLLRFHGKL